MFKKSYSLSLSLKNLLFMNIVTNNTSIIIFVRLKLISLEMW